MATTKPKKKLSSFSKSKNRSQLKTHLKVTRVSTISGKLPDKSQPIKVRRRSVISVNKVSTAKKITLIKQSGEVSSKAKNRKKIQKSVAAKRKSQTPISITKTKLVIKPWVFLVGILIGIFMTMTSGLYLVYRQTVLSFKVSPSIVAPQNLRGDKPLRTKLERLGIDTSIVDATIKNGIWETSDTAATYLSASARPAEGGNIVIYAHNRRQLFNTLPQAKIGDVIVVETANKQYRYQVSSIKTVQPDQIEAVLPTSYEVLTLYTCVGFLDSQRFVVQATPIGVSSI